MEAVILPILLVLALVSMSAFFSASEIGILSANRSKIHKLKLDGNPKAETLSKLRDDKERMIGALMLLNTFVNTAASVIASGFAIDFFGEGSYALLISTVVMTTLILIYGEILPKTYAVRNAENLAMNVAGFFTIVTKIFAPFTIYVQMIVNFTLKVFASRKPADEPMSGMEVMRGALEYHHEEGIMVPEDRYMIGGVIDLDKVTVSEIMVHRKEMESIDIDDDPSEIIDQIISSSHSRLPIWKDEPDNIIGVIHIKDLLQKFYRKRGDINRADIVKAMRKPWFIADITPLKKQLNAFKENQKHFSLVVDEYGELLGLVTLEDILEEVFGEIDDEYDTSTSHYIQKKPDGSVVVDGDVNIRDVNRIMHWEIATEDATTVGGLVFHLAQKIPSLGEVYKHDGLRFKVTKKSQNTVTKVRISPIKMKKKVKVDK